MLVSLSTFCHSLLIGGPRPGANQVSFITRNDSEAATPVAPFAQLNGASANRTHARLRVQCLEAEITEDEATAHQNIADDLIAVVNGVYPTERRMPGDRTASRKALFTVLAESVGEVTGDIYSVEHLLTFHDAAEPRCEICNRAKSALRCHLDIYNDVDGWPGNLFCDDCVLADMEPGPRVVMPARPEGYYHCAPGTFD